MPGRLKLETLMTALVADGRLNHQQSQEALQSQTQQSTLHPLMALAALSLTDLEYPDKTLSLTRLTQWLSARLDMPYRRIDPLKVDVARITGLMSYEFARRYALLPLSINEQLVEVATAEPLLSGWEDTIEQISQRRLRKVMANPDDILRFALEFYTLRQSVNGVTQGKSHPVLSHYEQLIELGSLNNVVANDEHIVKVVDWLFQYAFDQRASDIHLEPRRKCYPVRFRIDGVLHEVYQLPTAVGQGVISRIKVLARMNLAEKRRPQDGRIKTQSPDGNQIELRLSTLPTVFGEKLVMRIFDPSVLHKNFAELGLQQENLSNWQQMTLNSHGIVLVTGPTGSGKTTTLYATLKALATSDVNVCTIEDPIEMIEPAFNQMQVQPSIGLGFAEGVRALMRQDPDIIMIGEIRDLETAQMAIQAALTGHLVLSTVHTNDAPTAIARLLDLGVASYLIRTTVLGIMAQRLVRVLCPHCKIKKSLEPDLWQHLVMPWSAKPPAFIYEPQGCIECRNTGYMGRTGLYENFKMNAELAAIITENCDPHRVRRQAMKQGMMNLRLAGARKVAAGITTPVEVLRVTPEYRH